MWSCLCVRPLSLTLVPSTRIRIHPLTQPPPSFYCCIGVGGGSKRPGFRAGGGVRASMVDSGSSNFIKRMEQAWLISQQPRPIACTSCNSNGHVECQWCKGTGFFILGDDMLCQVPSRNTRCLICSGEGSKCCSDCKGTGFRAKWLGEPPITE